MPDPAALQVPTWLHSNTLDAGCDVLRDRPLTVLGQFMDASNGVLLVWLGSGSDAPRASDGIDPLALDPDSLAVYKPQRFERPLWDFPDGTLMRREVATYEFARVLGWDLVPPTVLREDGPAGAGSLQAFVPHDPAQHYFWLREQGDAVTKQLQQMVLFDLVANHADRKGSHVIADARVSDGSTSSLWLIDNGLTFHAEDKHRTVAWDFAGQPVPADLRADLAAVADRIKQNEALTSLLDADELVALIHRCRAVSGLETFPPPTGPRPIPWPPL